MLLEGIFIKPGTLPSRRCSLSGHTFCEKSSYICVTRTDVAHMFCASKIINCIYPCAQQTEIYYIIYSTIRIANSNSIFHCQLPVIIMVFNYSIYT